MFQKENQEKKQEKHIPQEQFLLLWRPTTCLVLVSSLKGLPAHIQQEALWLSHSTSQGYRRRATRLSDLPDRVLGISCVNLEQIRESLDNIMDYMVNNTPLNWLVGPFCPRMVAVETPTASRHSPSTPRKAAMESLQEET